MPELIYKFAEKATDFIFNLWVYGSSLNWAAPKLIAHRGVWDGDQARENTMAAFQRAQMLGIYGIELDVHFTKDNAPVVHHDCGLSRIFRDPGLLKEMTLAEVRSVTGDLPTLDEVLALKNLHFMIEIKTMLTTPQLEILKNCLAHLRPVDDYHLLALDPALVRETAWTPARAWVLVGELRIDTLVNIAIEKEYAGVACHYLGMRQKHITQLHAQGLKAGVGFSPNKNLFNKEWRRQVDWVFTNSASKIV